MKTVPTRRVAKRRPGVRTDRNAAHEFRKHLIAQGVDPVRVAETPDALLNRLARLTIDSPLRIVPDIDTVPVEDTVPNLAFRPVAVTDESPDEAESTRYFLMNLAGFDTDVPAAGLGADGYTPWDERGGDYYPTGGDAA